MDSGTHLRASALVYDEVSLVYDAILPVYAPTERVNALPKPICEVPERICYGDVCVYEEGKPVYGVGERVYRVIITIYAGPEPVYAPIGADLQFHFSDSQRHFPRLNGAVTARRAVPTHFGFRVKAVNQSRMALG